MSPRKFSWVIACLAAAFFSGCCHLRGPIRSIVWPPATENIDAWTPNPAQIPADGSVPILLTVSRAPANFVHKTTITWGYTDASGAFVRGGATTFDHHGGVLQAYIPPASRPREIEATAVVDYAVPFINDIVFVRKLPVTISGVSYIFQPSGFVCRTHLLLIPPTWIWSSDYVTLSWNCHATTGNQPNYEHRGVFNLDARDLHHPIALAFELPVRKEDAAVVDWALDAQIKNKACHDAGSFDCTTPLVHLTINSANNITHTP